MSSQSAVPLGLPSDEDGVLALAHELRQPVSAMKMRLQLALVGRGADEAVVRELLEHLAHLEEILAQHPSPPPADAVETVGGWPSELDLSEEIRRALGMLPHDAQVCLEVHVPQGTVVLRHRAVSVRQVVVNLVRNALDAVSTVERRRVRVEVQVDPDAVRVIVEDSGPGLSPDVAHRLFEPFVTTKRPGEGTGLGLFIARRTLQEEGGTLVVADSGPGARFVAVFPRAELRRS